MATKQYILSKRKLKLSGGGNITDYLTDEANFSTVGSAASTVGGLVTAADAQDGKKSVAGQGAGMALSGAGIGMSIGGPMGAAIGAGAGFAYGSISTAIENKKIEEAKAKAEEEAKRLKVETDKAYLANYPTKGYSYNSLYPGGGKVNINDTDMNKLVPLASNVDKAIGATHEQGGIQLSPNAEIEGQELVRQNPYNGDTEIDSRRLGTTNVTEPLSIMKGQLEESAKPLKLKLAKLTTELKRTTDFYLEKDLKRKIEKAELTLAPIVSKIAEIDAATEQAFAQQEAMKDQQGIPDDMGQGQQQFAGGGKWVNGIWVEDEVNYSATPQTPNYNKYENYNNLGKTNTLTAINTPGVPNVGNSKINNLAPVIPYNSSLYDENGNMRTYEGFNAPLMGNKPSFDDVETPEVTADYMDIKFDKYKPKGSGIGGSISKTGKSSFSDIAPYIDNVGNLIISANEPQVPKPTYLKHAPLNTNYDISASLQDTNNELRAYNKGVEQSTADSGVRNARTLAGLSAGIAGKNQLHQTKTNEELKMDNMNKLNIQEVDKYNNALTDNYNMLKAQRKGAQLSDLSTNLANVEGNVKDKIGENNLKDYQSKILDLESKKYGDTGVWVNSIEALRSDSDYANILDRMILSQSDFDRLYKNPYTSTTTKGILNNIAKTKGFKI